MSCTPSIAFIVAIEVDVDEETTTPVMSVGLMCRIACKYWHREFRWTWPCLSSAPPPGVTTSQTQQAYYTSQLLQPEEALYLRKKKRPILHEPYTRFSALLYRRPPREDQKAILASMDNIDLDHSTLLWKPLRTRSQSCNMPSIQKQH